MHYSTKKAFTASVKGNRLTVITEIVMTVITFDWFPFCRIFHARWFCS